MMSDPRPDDRGAAALFAIAQVELRRLAAKVMRAERPGHTIQPTALVHEAYLRLCRNNTLQDIDRQAFIALAAKAMRSILIDHARRRQAVKRGRGAPPITLDANALSARRPVDCLALNDVLERLESLDGRAARVVEMRFFGGMTTAEVADALGVSKRTVESDWAFARAWLHKALAEEGAT